MSNYGFTASSTKSAAGFITPVLGFAAFFLFMVYIGIPFVVDAALKDRAYQEKVWADER